MSERVRRIRCVKLKCGICGIPLQLIHSLLNKAFFQIFILFFTSEAQTLMHSSTVPGPSARVGTPGLFLVQPPELASAPLYHAYVIENNLYP